MTDCPDKYRKFITDGNLIELENCYYKYPPATPEAMADTPTVTKAPSPIDQ